MAAILTKHSTPLPIELCEVIHNFANYQERQSIADAEQFRKFIRQLGFSTINHPATLQATGVQRAFLNVIGGGTFKNPSADSIQVYASQLLLDTWENIIGWKGINLDIPIYSVTYYLG